MKNGIGLSQAFRTLSIIPFPGKDASDASKSLVFYPAVGIVLGLLSTFIPFIISKNNSDYPICLLCGALYTVMMALFTRAFHLDGLGDTADGFGSSWEKEKILSVMSDSRSGSFSVVSICSVIVLKVLSSAVLFSRKMFVYTVLSVMISRSFTVFACCFGKYAKEKGLSYDLVTGAKFRQLLIVLFFDAAVFALGIYFNILNLKKTVFAFAICSVSLSLLLLESYRKIQGITGDVLGACTEITETAALVCLCLV